MLYLFWGVYAVGALATLWFYLRMRKVGRLLGGRYRVRMDAALTLAVVIPFFLSFVPGGNEGVGLFVALCSAVSFMAGVLLLPGILLDALQERYGEENTMKFEVLPERDDFEEQVQAIRERQRAKRESRGQP